MRRVGKWSFTLGGRMRANVDGHVTARRKANSRLNVGRCTHHALLLSTIFTFSNAWAGSGPLGIDRTVTYDNSGIWARRNQNLLISGMMIAEAGVGLWEGGDTRLGQTMWKSIDATLVGGLSSQILKRAFSRPRPSQSNDPNQWFKGHGYQSFPSGEVTVTSAIVTPIVLEYGEDHPWVYALGALPIYDGIARVKVHGHWQSDVIAGFALGTAAGYFMHKRHATPLVLSVLPNSFYVGFGKRFH